MSENGTGSVIAAPTPEQYRRRRAIAGALAALILLLLIWGMVSLVNAIRGGDDENVTVQLQRQLLPLLVTSANARRSQKVL